MKKPKKLNTLVFELISTLPFAEHHDMHFLGHFEAT